MHVTHSLPLAYQGVDFQSPVTTLWITGVLLVVAAMAIVHAIWRRRKHRAYATSTARNIDPNVIRDTRVEQIVGYVLIGLALLLAGLAALGAWQTHQAVRDNLQAKYQVTEVTNDRWSGAFLVADLTKADGTVLKDEKVFFEPNGEPLMGEDIFFDMVGGG